MNHFLRKIRIALTPREWQLQTRLANGAVVSGRNRPGYGGRGLYIYRDALEPELEKLELFLVPGGVLLDIGGNTGAFTIKAAQYFRKHGGGTVVTYEPLPEMVAELNHNVHLNGFDNVRLRSFCLGAEPSTAEFWINFNRPNSSGLMSRDPQAKSRSTLVLRLDDVFPLEKLARLDYVKIDVEGAESLVLAGAVETVKKFRPIIQLETGLRDASVELSDYAVWQSPGGPNKVYIPLENVKNEVARQLGWQKLA